MFLIQERQDTFKPFQVFPCKEKKTCKVSVKSDIELAVQHLLESEDILANDIMLEGILNVPLTSIVDDSCIRAELTQKSEVSGQKTQRTLFHF